MFNIVFVFIGTESREDLDFRHQVVRQCRFKYLHQFHGFDMILNPYEDAFTFLKFTVVNIMCIYIHCIFWGNRGKRIINECKIY